MLGARRTARENIVARRPAARPDVPRQRQNPPSPLSLSGCVQMENESRSHETVDLRQDGRRIVITLCRPEIHNAQNETLIDDLFDITGGLHDRDDFEVVLRSSGEHWCTGLDMKAHRNGWRPDRAFAEKWDTAIANLQALDQIVVGL